MFDSPFERKIKKLASESGLKIADLKASGAKFLFNVRGHTQPLFVVPYGETWELSCPTIVALDALDDFPQFILAIALKDNSTNKRGFWCIEKIGGKEVLEYMHNIPEASLTADEFYKSCRIIVEQVEKLEDAFRQALRL
ncbi:MAG: hypothetical protein D6709_00275 [Chloroflexi bacterium]|jgi:hypothetical protein|uniref:hypothetical protein n=1 Tax=Candidatus Roseilinea sp. NK_OTU-006 TaxID=2704250 RepID=UPI000F2620CE|nr:hypothetical protein [Candidatus Roseilinea sp. NK_OTU-006]RMG66225.1 MAG: hypothetical protein D6709_00275 [Chloroflexota bacterium]